MISKQAILEIIGDMDYIHAGIQMELANRINLLPSISDGWISVGELPNKDGRYLCLVPLNMFKHCEVEFKNGSWEHYNKNITHWMELPPAPTK